jgi:hypothetical protein
MGWHGTLETMNFTGAIIPQICNCTEGAGWGCVLQVIQQLFHFLMYFGVLAAVAFIAYGGFLLITNPTNPGNVTKARAVMLDAVIGLVVVLAAWLIVNTLFTVLTSGTVTSYTAVFGSTSQNCLPTAKDQQGTGGATTGLGPSNGVANGPIQNGPGACNSVNVQQGAAAGGYTLSSSQSQTLACIAKYESACGTKNLNYAWGKGSSAAGAFQVTMQSNSSCYDNTACETAVGQSTPLNCASGFSGGNPIPGSPVVQKCVQAAASLNCSASAAACLLQKQTFTQAWAADSHSSGQQQCISEYGQT